MAIRGSSKNPGTSATPQATIPSTNGGAQNGDIGVIVVGWGAHTDISSFVPSGFQLFPGRSTGSGSWVGDGSYLACWKRLTGSESGTWDFSDIGSSADWIALCAVLSGRHATNNPDGSTLTPVGNTGTPLTLTADAIATTQGDDLLWFPMMDYASGPQATTMTYTPPSGFTGGGSGYSQEYFSASSFRLPCALHYKEAAAAQSGATSGSVTWDGGALLRSGTTLIRVPAAPGGGLVAPATAGLFGYVLRNR